MALFSDAELWQKEPGTLCGFCLHYGDLEEGMKNRMKISNQGMDGASEARRKG